MPRDPTTSAFDPPADRFEVRDELGRGGMGVVTEAFDRALGRPVAVKHMLSSSDVDRARFEREARITARLEHPGIVPIHDAGRSADGTPYYVMRRIDGDPLEKLVVGRPFSERLTLVPNLLAACDATAFAHAHRVIHRDIKPSNILIGPFGETLVIDWGLARSIGDANDGVEMPQSDPTLTRAGLVAGTPGFMPPEQARGETVDERADVFALGATLFFVLAGDLPYSIDRPTEMVDHVGADRPPDWRKLPVETPPDLRAIVEKAMASDRSQRYADAGALAADLRQFVTGQLVGAYRYGRIEQLRRFVRRHRAAVGVGGVAALVVAVIATLSIQRVLVERDDANAARAVAEVQRREATSTAEQMLVQTAGHIVERDPAAAVVLLRRLSPGSTEWPRAATVAAAAAARGIPFGFTFAGRAPMLKTSPDSRHVLLHTADGPRLLIDLHTRTRREIAAPPTNRMVWLDARWLLGIDTRTVVLVDTSTNTSRSIPVPDDLVSVESDRRGHGWVHASRDVFAFDSTSTQLGVPVIRDADEVLVVGENKLALVRDDRLELWTPSGPPIRVEDREIKGATIIGGEGVVGARRGEELCIWLVRETPVLQRCLGTGLSLLFALTERDVFTMNQQKVERIGLTTRHSSPTNRSSPGASGTGAIWANQDGSIHLHDSRGFFTLPSRSFTFRWVAQTADERFVVATTSTKEILIWDLSIIRPREVPLESTESVIGVTPTELWTLELGSSVHRVDRRSGERTVVAGPGLDDAGLSADGRWMWSRDGSTGTFSAYDTVAHTGISFGKDVAVLVDRGGPLVAHPDGEVMRFRAADAKERLGAFAFKPTLMASSSGFVVGSTNEPRPTICRLVIHGAATCTEITGSITEVAVTDSGTMWSASSDGLWRWKVGAPVQRIPSPAPFEGTFWSGEQLVGVMSGQYAVLGEGDPRFLATSAIAHLGPGNDVWMTGTTAQRDVVVIHLATGISYALPALRPTLGVARGRGNSVAVKLEGGRAAIWDVPSPTDPQALRAWLATATNAEASSSEGVTWP